MEWDWGRIVFDHVTLTVGDAEASKAFYGTVLATLGIPPLWDNERGAQAYGLNATRTRLSRRNRPHRRLMRAS